jgi:hypothetical protein
MKIINKKLITIIFLLLFSINKVHATGLPVFDASTAAGLVQQLQAMQQMIEHNTEMAKKVGDGEFTPSTINWMNSWYTKCGGGKYTLPDWFPHPKLNICGDSGKILEAGVDWYEKEILITDLDTPKQAEIKAKKQLEAVLRVRKFILSTSVTDMRRGEEDQKAIKELQKALESANDQIKVQKIQTQIMIQMLAELQKLNIQQAEVLHLTAIKN